MAKRKRRKIKGDSKDSDVETPHKSEISRKSNSNSNKGTRTSKRQSIGSDEDASKSASSPVTRTRTRSKPNQPATRKSPRGQEPVPATPAAAKSDSKSSSKPSNRKLIDAIRYVEEASPKTISISSDDIPKFESKPDKPATRRSSRSREPSAPATPADPVKSNLISSSKPSSCKPIVNTKTKDVNKASETKSISDDDSPAKSKRNQSPTRRSSRGRQPSVPATADPAKPNSKSSNSKQGCEMSVDTEDVDEASDTESISDDIPAKSKPNQPPTRRSSRGKQPVPATTDTIESNLKSISKPSNCEMIDTEDVVEASDTKSMSGDDIPAISNSKSDKNPLPRKSPRGKQPSEPATADPAKSNSKSNSKPNSKLNDERNVEEAHAPSATQTLTPLQPRTPTTITLHIANPEQRLGLELYETKLRTSACKTMLDPVVAIRSVLPNGLAADVNVNVNVGNTGDVDSQKKLCPGMMLLEYPTKADLVDRFRKGPYPIELRFLTVGVPSNIIHERVSARKAPTRKPTKSRDVNINDTAWFESFDDPLPAKLDENQKVEESPNSKAISDSKASKLPNSKSSSKSVAKSSKSNSQQLINADSDAEDVFEYMDSDFDSDVEGDVIVHMNGSGTISQPGEDDSENEGYGSERVTASEMYVCELREELWKRGVNVTVGKEKKKELVRLLEQQWTEEASGKPNGIAHPLRNKPSPEVPVPSEFGIQRRKEKLALETELADFLNTEDCWHPDVKDASVPKSLTVKANSKPSRSVRKVGRPRKQPSLTVEPEPPADRASKSRSRSKSRSKRIESDDASDQSIFVEFNLPSKSKPKPKAILDSDSDDEKPVRKVGRPPNKKQKSKAILDSDDDEASIDSDSGVSDNGSEHKSSSEPRTRNKVGRPPNKKLKSKPIDSDSDDEAPTASISEPRHKSKSKPNKVVTAKKFVKKVGRPPNKKQKSKSIDSDSDVSDLIDDDDEASFKSSSSSDQPRRTRKTTSKHIKPSTLKPVKVDRPSDKKQKSRRIDSDSEVSDEASDELHTKSKLNKKQTKNIYDSDSEDEPPLKSGKRSRTKTTKQQSALQAELADLLDPEDGASESQSSEESDSYGDESSEDMTSGDNDSEELVQTSSEEESEDDGGRQKLDWTPKKKNSDSKGSALKTRRTRALAKLAKQKSQKRSSMDDADDSHSSASETSKSTSNSSDESTKPKRGKRKTREIRSDMLEEAERGHANASDSDNSDNSQSSKSLDLNPQKTDLNLGNGIIVPKLLATQLRHHQIDGLKFMHQSVVEKKGCVLAHCMGLGKTLQAVTLLSVLLDTPVEWEGESGEDGAEEVVERGKVSEMYVGELRDELRKRGVDVTKVKKKELVVLLEQKYKEEAAKKNKNTNHKKDDDDGQRNIREMSVVEIRDALRKRGVDVTKVKKKELVVMLEQKWKEEAAEKKTKTKTNSKNNDSDDDDDEKKDDDSDNDDDEIMDDVQFDDDNSGDSDDSGKKKRKKKRKPRTALIVCPVNVLLNWEDEFEKWLGELAPPIYSLQAAGPSNAKRAALLEEWHLTGGILIIGYDQYRNLTVTKRSVQTPRHRQIFQRRLVNPGPGLLVCDEGHILRNAQSGLSQALNMIQTRRRIVLTGTPLQNNLSEYHCMIDFVRPGLLGNHSAFLRDFVRVIEKGACEDSTGKDVRLMKQRAHVLHGLLKVCVHRADLKVLQRYLPPKHEYALKVRMSSLQVQLYWKYLYSSGHADETADGKTVVKELASQTSKLFEAYHHLAKIWTHPGVLQMEREGMARTAASREVKAYDSIDDWVCESSDEDWSDDEDAAADFDRCAMKGKGRKQKLLEKKKNEKKKNNSSVNEDNDADTEAETKKSDQGDNSSGKESNPPNWWETIMANITDDTEAPGLSGKMLVMLQILKEAAASKEKVLLFSQSLFVLELIERVLEAGGNDGRKLRWKLGRDYFRLDGSTAPKTRQGWVDRFNDRKNRRARLFLISTKAGGLGVNLSTATRVIIFDAAWNPSVDSQAVFRAYRFGQTREVFVYRLLAAGTMEEKIYHRQVNKNALASRVVDKEQKNRNFKEQELVNLYSFEPDGIIEEDSESGDGENGAVAVTTRNDTVDIGDKKGINDRIKKFRNCTDALPHDPVLIRLLGKMQPKWLLGYVDHDALATGEGETELSTEEEAVAWAEYEAASKAASKAEEEAAVVLKVQTKVVPTKPATNQYPRHSNGPTEHDYITNAENGLTPTMLWHIKTAARRTQTENAARRAQEVTMVNGTRDQFPPSNPKHQAQDVAMMNGATDQYPSYSNLPPEHHHITSAPNGLPPHIPWLSDQYPPSNPMHRAQDVAMTNGATGQHPSYSNLQPEYHHITSAPNRLSPNIPSHPEMAANRAQLARMNGTRNQYPPSNHHVTSVPNTLSNAEIIRREKKIVDLTL